MPNRVKASIDDWLQAANLTAGKLFRRVNKNGSAWGDGLTEKAVWHVMREYAYKAGIERLAPHDFRSYAESRAMPGCRRFWPGGKPEFKLIAVNQIFFS